MRPLCAILGPTASGKSALAHAVARAVEAQVLAVDSMTVYRRMDIGTAKPTSGERVEVEYHGLDLADPNETFTVARWLAEAEQVIGRAEADGRPLILVGGTPLYFQALFHGLFDGPAADASYRAELSALSPDALHRNLTAIDPSAAARIHRNDRRRLTRALEVHRATGTPISEHQTQWGQAARYPAVRFGLAWPRPELNGRINARTKQMIAADWLDEVRGLLDRYGTFSPTAAEAAGYRLLSEVVGGQMRLDDAIEQIKIKTRQLAKRQMSWFRRFDAVAWLHGDAPLEENVAAVLRGWTESPHQPRSSAM